MSDNDYVDVEAASKKEAEEKQKRSDLCFSAVEFLRAMTDYKGHEEGMKLWEKIISEWPEVKGDVFVAMISGDTRQVMVRHDPNSYSKNKVGMIKAVRAATYWGLKEAKDWVDNMETLGKDRLEIRDKEARDRFRHEARDSGYTVY